MINFIKILGAAIAPYLFVAFIQWELDVSVYHGDTRAAIALLSLMSVSGIFLYIKANE